MTEELQVITHKFFNLSRDPDCVPDCVEKTSKLDISLT